MKLIKLLFLIIKIYFLYALLTQNIEIFDTETIDRAAQDNNYIYFTSNTTKSLLFGLGTPTQKVFRFDKILKLYVDSLPDAAIDFIIGNVGF